MDGGIGHFDLLIFFKNIRLEVTMISTQILKWILKGYNTIDVSRFGSEKNNTRYEIDPIL
jgi:hypothetical protein